MKKLLLYISMIGVCSVSGMYSPHISYYSKSGKFVKTRIADIGAEAFSSMSPSSFDMIEHLLQSYQSYIQTATTLDDDEFTADDAYFALNGAKMQLKEALKESCYHKRELLQSALSSLNSIREQGYEEILGYKYCFAILCLHFWEDIDVSMKSIFFSSSQIPLDVRAYGLELMSVAAKPKTAGGDDDSDAASYLQYKR